MAFFSELGENISVAGKEVSKRAKGFTDTKKLELEMKKKEDLLERQYAEIGRQYYEIHKQDEEPEFQEMGVIAGILEEMEELGEEISKMKGERKCPSCGAVIERDAVFCKKCGAKCEEPEP